MTSTASPTASTLAPAATSATALVSAARPACRAGFGTAGPGPRPAPIQTPIPATVPAPVPGAGSAEHWLLPPGAVRRLPEPPPGGQPLLLQVCSGRIWLTQAGDADDHFLSPGHAPWALGAGCVIESDGAEPARVRLGPASQA